MTNFPFVSLEAVHENMRTNQSWFYEYIRGKIEGTIDASTTDENLRERARKECYKDIRLLKAIYIGGRFMGQSEGFQVVGAHCYIWDTDVTHEQMTNEIDFTSTYTVDLLFPVDPVDAPDTFILVKGIKAIGRITPVENDMTDEKTHMVVDYVEGFACLETIRNNDRIIDDEVVDLLEDIKKGTKKND